jgi:hypothetical protein
MAESIGRLDPFSPTIDGVLEQSRAIQTVVEHHCKGSLVMTRRIADRGADGREDESCECALTSHAVTTRFGGARSSR